jgi:RNA polymerase subunit RPABC4/transcription elongation factor Spt4
MVSQGSIVTSDGQKLCSSCKRRPRRKGQRTCRECHTVYVREWRSGKVQMMLTPAEASLIRDLRAAEAGEPGGRHARR